MALFDKWKLQWPVTGKTQPVQETPKQESRINEPEDYIAGENGPLPPTSGRSSVPDNITTFAPSQTLQEVQPDFALEWLGTLQNLASFNPDFSYAVDNIIQLANTEHEIEFSDKVSDSKAKAMRQYLKENEGNWYAYSGGMRSLKADLIAQLVINGCISAENVPNDKLNGIKQVVRVAPKDIRFVYDPKTDMYKPYQQAPITHGRARGVNGLIELNTATYHYIALRRFGNTPYPVPPLITAVEGLIIQKKMNANLSKIMDKLGMLGFLSANVTKPDKRPGETPESYYARLNSYLDNVVYPQIAKNLGQGIVAGYTGSHEFKLEGNNMNVTGAEGLVKIVQLMIFSGLKQDPNMLGRNYSTTETFGRVILTKMVSQVKDYQTVVDTFLEQLYLLALRLAGFSPGYVKVTSKTPLISDQYKDAQTEEINIRNVKTKRDMGVIGQDQTAQELNYDKPFSKEPLNMEGANAAAPVAPINPADTTVGTDGTTAQNAIELIAHLEEKYNSDAVEFPYAHVCGEGLSITRENFQNYTDFGDPKLNAFMKTYFNVVNKQYKKAVEAIIPHWSKRMTGYTTGTDVETIQRDLYMVMLQYWEPYFTSKIKDDVKKNVHKIYDHFRKDESIFDGATSLAIDRKGESLFDIPPPVFGLQDFRAMEFMEQCDNLYLGKFITDKDSKKRFYQFIYEQYLDGGMPIGKGEQDINAWLKGFSNEISSEAWKIRRIIDTTVSKARNFGNLNYINQSQIQKFEVIEIEDKLTCDYCMHLAGRVFSVNVGVSHLNKEVSAGPGGVGINAFATSLKLDKFQAMSTAELEAAGYLVPPFHPHCRGRIVAKF